MENKSTQLLLMKINPHGKWHSKGPYDRAWCGLAIWETVSEAVRQGGDVQYQTLDEWNLRQERGDRTVCKKCVQG